MSEKKSESKLKRKNTNFKNPFDGKKSTPRYEHKNNLNPYSSKPRRL